MVVVMEEEEEEEDVCTLAPMTSFMTRAHILKKKKVVLAPMTCFKTRAHILGEKKGILQGPFYSRYTSLPSRFFYFLGTLGTYSEKKKAFYKDRILAH
jgi:hypothetical protein